MVALFLCSRRDIEGGPVFRRGRRDAAAAGAPDERPLRAHRGTTGQQGFEVRTYSFSRFA